MSDIKIKQNKMDIEVFEPTKKKRRKKNHHFSKSKLNRSQSFDNTGK